MKDISFPHKSDVERIKKMNSKHRRNLCSVFNKKFVRSGRIEPWHVKNDRKKVIIMVLDLGIL